MPGLSGKAYIDGLLFRPSIAEARAYYSHPDVLNELLEGMRLWHVRFEPENGARHRWFNVSDPVQISDALLRALDRMSHSRPLFPYMRIDGRRFQPVDSWEPGDMWGRDLVLEKDGPSWRYCWDAMLPVLRMLDRLGVHYWMKYTGHHSLHVVVPAEGFPRVTPGLPLAEIFGNLAWRIIAFLDVACYQPVTDGGFGGGSAGTNMPFTLNEHSGLLNYPVLATEMGGFRPEHACISAARVRSFWREFPALKRASAAKLLAASVADISQTDLPDEFSLVVGPPSTFDDTVRSLSSRHWEERRMAVRQAPWFRSCEAGDLVIRSLNDPNRNVRKAAVKALVGVDHPHEKQALQKIVEGAELHISDWARRVLEVKRDIGLVRQAIEHGLLTS